MTRSLTKTGTSAKPPISLVEVQAYAYAAFRGLAPVFAALGDSRLAAKLQEDASALARRFNRDFWLPSNFYALALDGTGKRAASIASNAGQVLWGGAASRSHAAKVVRRLMEPDMFSGWGIRTLNANSAGTTRSVTTWAQSGRTTTRSSRWDSSATASRRSSTESRRALFDAARAFPYYRLPELFGGDERSVHQAPVPYPIACRPQAWAAGSIPLITQAILGLCPDATASDTFHRAPATARLARIGGCRRRCASATPKSTSATSAEATGPESRCSRSEATCGSRSGVVARTGSRNARTGRRLSVPEGPDNRLTHR